MAKQVQFRRGTTSEHSTFTGAVGEVTVDTDKDVVVVHDGSTAGGFPLVRQLSDLSITSTASELNILDGVTATATELNLLDGVTATTAELNYLDITTLGTTEASKAVTADANGVVTFDNGIVEEFTTVTSSSNAVTCNLRDGTHFVHTLTENTEFTFSNAASSGKVSVLTLKLIQDSSASGYTVTWPEDVSNNAIVDWAAGTAPTLTATASAVDYFVFITHDGGSSWYGFTAGQAMATPA